ncbi:MAG TPA: chloride channel protein, partial [Polyangiales bacterium]|nr:chloride channel protein [Polyangiales bacterium]
MTSSEVPTSAAPRWSNFPRSTSTLWRFSLAVVVVGAAAGGFAIAFRFLLAIAVRKISGAPDLVSAMGHLPIALRLLYPALGGLFAGLLSLAVARIGHNQGVGDVMEAVVLGKVRLSMRVTLLRSLASWCAIVSGGSIGREGPLIQFGGAVGEFVSRRL